MWRNKKLILIGVLAVVALVTSLGIAAVAHADDEDTLPVQNTTTSLIEKVAAIYEANTGIALDPQELENAFIQARNQLRIEIRYQCLDNLVEQGKITQEQFENKKSWIESMPDKLPVFGFRGHGGFRGMGGMSGFGGPCALAE